MARHAAASGTPPGDQAAPGEPAPPTGVENALRDLRRLFDEDAQVLWRANGPRRSHVVEFNGVMCELGDAGRRVIVVAGLNSGSYKLYTEIPGKTAGQQLEKLAATFGVDLGVPEERRKEVAPEPAE